MAQIIDLAKRKEFHDDLKDLYNLFDEIIQEAPGESDEGLSISVHVAKTKKDIQKIVSEHTLV